MKKNNKKKYKIIGVSCFMLLVVIFTNLIFGEFLSGWKNPK